MIKLKQLKINNESIYPVTHEGAVMDNNGESLESKITKINDTIENIDDSMLKVEDYDDLMENIEPNIKDKVDEISEQMDILNKNKVENKYIWGMDNLSKDTKDIITRDNTDEPQLTDEQLEDINEISTLKDNIGDKSQLLTENKEDLVKALNEVFTSASSGKELIANAITGKGIATDRNASYLEMSQNISNLNTSSGGNVSSDDIELLTVLKSKTNMSYMFAECSNLTTIPLLDTSNATNMSYIFYSCRNLTTIPSLDTSNVTNMGNMFSGCSSITSIPSLDTSNVTSMNSMFDGCTNLINIPLLNTSKVTTMSYMFYSCRNLTEIHSLDTSKVTHMSSTFSGCTSLKTLTFNPNATNIVNFQISSCTSMEREDLIIMFESLPTMTTKTVTITLGSTLLNKLEEEDKQIATSKGYVLA